MARSLGPRFLTMPVPAAAAITTLAATRLPLLGVVGVGVASIVALRSLGL